MNKTIHLAIDLDGVCAKFDERILELSSKPAHVLDQQNLLWPLVAATPNFFKHLDPYPEMVDLVNEMRALGVPLRIITGRPRRDTMKRATQDKLDWCAKHFGDVEVIVCLSRDKPKYIKPGVIDILIDDRHQNIDSWRLKGGTAIHHTTHDLTRPQLFNLLTT